MGNSHASPVDFNTGPVWTRKNKKILRPDDTAELMEVFWNYRSPICDPAEKTKALERSEKCGRHLLAAVMRALKSTRMANVGYYCAEHTEEKGIDYGTRVAFYTKGGTRLVYIQPGYCVPFRYPTGVNELEWSEDNVYISIRVSVYIDGSHSHDVPFAASLFTRRLPVENNRKK